MHRYLSLAIGFAMMIGMAGGAFAAEPIAEASDPFQWLEDVHGPRAMAWVEAENAKTLGVLEGDARFAGLRNDALKIAQAADRIPTPAFIGGKLYNFWQDGAHVRGLWRRTTVASYNSNAPVWAPILDIDALAKADGANWVFDGAQCEWRAEQRCLINLSDGGEDAVTLREFDLTTGAFAPKGFVLPKGKQSAAWLDPDTLLVAREWTPGALTQSGYPYVVKRVRRGEPLASAREVFRGEPNDVSVTLSTLHDGAGHQASLIHRGVSFFEFQTWILTRSGPRQMALPLKSGVDDLVAGRLIVSLQEDWSVGGQTFPKGSVISLDLAATLKDPNRLVPTLVFTPGPRGSVRTVRAAKSRLILVANENVKGRGYVFAPGPKGTWRQSRLDLPDNASINVITEDSHSDQAYLSVTSFLTPTTLWMADAARGTVKRVKSVPPKFDASRDAIDQYEAVSSDGTRIPYFVVHPKTMALDGSNPTIVYAYGGFQLSMTPGYNATLGKLWLERGGVYVLANIRGGGEFGPAWHEAGLKTRRQRVFDDFTAVARDLIARRITSPRRLGIQGGSNGGLLMGVSFTQHPELWTAVDIQVPLLDMLRYESIAAGPSWVGEYGSVANPEERAFLGGISPYHHLSLGTTYPEPLIWTTTKDDRVGPQHARKFAARLASLGKPYLFYEVTEGGHGSGANLKQRAHTSALEYLYFVRKLMD